MQLTIDITPALVRSAGVKNHIYYWSRALEAAKGANRIDYYPFAQLPASLDHDRGIEAGIPNWRLFVVFGMNHPALHSLTRSLLPRTTIFHGSPALRRKPRTARLTSHIHDLTSWLMPELHTRANVKAAHELADNVWRKADGLIAVSKSARDDAERVLGLDPSRIAVIYHGVPEHYFNVSPEEGARVRTALGLGGNYCLAVGTVEPRKNLERLLDAWMALPADVRDEFELVIAGPAGWKAESTMSRLKNYKSGVRYLGYVSESDLPALTAGATALLYPSLYEGFGFPLAQAMACGVPSLTSNVSSMPEVAAGSAVLIDPESVDEIREGLLQLLTSPSLRQALGAKGREHASTNYRWEIAAAQSWEFFARVAQ